MRGGPGRSRCCSLPGRVPARPSTRGCPQRPPRASRRQQQAAGGRCGGAHRRGAAGGHHAAPPHHRHHQQARAGWLPAGRRGGAAPGQVMQQGPLSSARPARPCALPPDPGMRVSRSRPHQPGMSARPCSSARVPCCLQVHRRCTAAECAAAAAPAAAAAGGACVPARCCRSSCRGQQQRPGRRARGCAITRAAASPHSCRQCAAGAATGAAATAAAAAGHGKQPACPDLH